MIEDPKLTARSIMRRYTQGLEAVKSLKVVCCVSPSEKKAMTGASQGPMEGQRRVFGVRALEETFWISTWDENSGRQLKDNGALHRIFCRIRRHTQGYQQERPSTKWTPQPNVQVLPCLTCGGPGLRKQVLCPIFPWP